MSSVAGIIFSNIHDNNIPELTRMRTIASVPFGCRYRFIDFTLSNMVNSDIYNIYVVTHNNYNSLMDHLGSGKDWDLARRSGGIKILPPNALAYSASGSDVYTTRLGALKSISHAILRIKEDYVVLSDCDAICNIDLNDVVEQHISTGADMTFVVKDMDVTAAKAENSTIFFSDSEKRATDVLAYPKNFEGRGEFCLNIIVVSTKYLQQMVVDATAHSYTSMTRDIISRNVGHANYYVYKYDGFFGDVSSMEDYFKLSMEIINSPAARDSLFNVPNRPVYTKVRYSTPAYYSSDSSVSNSLIADGCQIHGTVENSILFRGVKVGKGAVVRNSILMQDTGVGDNAELNCVISDKNAVISENTVLSGASSLPFYIMKGKKI